MEKVVRRINKMHRISKLVLHTGLPIISIAFLAVLFFIRSPIWETWYIHRLLPSILEYLMMSLTLLIGGALLIDYITAKNEEENNPPSR
ncbi:MAG: hypothetical protein GX303_01535 [Clostridiales bacterium]|nr:hypothetical protein [Clostridiales bacterium]